MQSLDARIQSWILRRDAPEDGPICLHRRRVYIVPTRAGFLFAAVLVAMLIASINYQLSLGYLFTFLVGAIAVVGMHRTHDTLLDMEISCIEALPTHAGQNATFVLRLVNPHRHARAGLIFLIDGKQVIPGEVHILPSDQRDVAIEVPALLRGWLPCPRVRIQTVFPLGLFRAWSYAWPQARALVYPALSRMAAEPSGLGRGAGGNRHGSGQDAFSHVSAYQEGDDVRRLHWPSFAREQVALRVHEGEAGEEQVFRLDAQDPDVNLEERLSRLASALVHAQQRRVRFALVLDAESAQLATGDAHLHECLGRLALYQPQRNAHGPGA
jgi:uncharacterized protein (DUF58 family)